MQTIGELCDRHAEEINSGGKNPFYVSIIDPLVAAIEQTTPYKGTYEIVGGFDRKACLSFKYGTLESAELLVDYTGSDSSGRSLMIWVDREDVPESCHQYLSHHLSGTIIIVPREWTIDDFAKLILFRP